MRASVPGFFGPANPLASISADAETTYNWLLEPTAPGVAKAPVWHRQTPGRVPFAWGASGWVRGQLALDDGATERAFAVIGTHFYEIFSDGSSISRGTVVDDNEPASIATNGTAGNQVMVCAGQRGYIFNLTTNAFAIIADVDFPNGHAEMCEFWDGYFIVLKTLSRTFQWSALEDGTSWDALDVAERSTASDNIIAILRVSRTLVLLGSRTTEPWYDNGDVNTPFAPIQNTLINQGCIAPFTAKRVGDTYLWLSKNDNGRCEVLRGSDGFRGERVSTHAVEHELQRTVSPADAQAAVLQMDGHVFYVLTVPGELDCSWTYDLTTQAWFKWAVWDSTACVFLQSRINNQMFVFGKQLVGDFDTPTLYDCSFDYLTDVLVTP